MIQKIFLDNLSIQNISLSDIFTDEEPDNPQVRRMKKILNTALHTELTDRQYQCIKMRYFERKNINDIADIMHIKPTTVYKHLEKALKTLKKCTAYL